MAVASISAEVGRRAGPSHLWHSYRMMVRFEVLNLRTFLAFALVIQILMGAGMGVMYGFYLGDLPGPAQTFLVSGIPALALFPIGFVGVPASIADSRFEGTYDYIWSLPVPRLASALAGFTVFSALGIPGTALALWISQAVYGVELSLSWMILPAVVASAAVATSVGFAIGHGIADPRMTNLLTNLLVFLVLMFSPIVVPIEMFPEWFAAVHRVLPFWHMANVLRDSVTEGLVASPGVSYLVLAVWIALSWTAAGRVISRRR